MHCQLACEWRGAQLPATFHTPSWLAPVAQHALVAAWRASQASSGASGPQGHTTHVLLQVCIVTGGATGIGFSISQALAECGAHVILACRPQDSADSACEVGHRGFQCV